MLVENEAVESPLQPETTPSGADWVDLLAPRYLVSTIMLCLGVALFAFNEFFVSTSMPTAVKELGRPWLLAWAFTVYLVFAIVGGALAAHMKQRFGGRVTLCVATALFVGGTLFACFADHPWHLLMGRLLQGLGEGITISVCYALIPELFPKQLMPKVFGSEAIAWAAAAFGGPLLAGVLTEYVSWRAAFASSLPAALIFIVLVLIMLPKDEKRDPVVVPMPLLRLLLIGASVLMISVSSMTANVPLILLLVLAATALLMAFIGLDRRNANAILPQHAFSPKGLPGAGLWVVLLMPFAGSASAVYLVYGLQTIWSLGPAEAGIASAVMALSWSLTAILVASVKSTGLRHRLIFTGPILFLFGLGGIITALSTNRFWLVYPSQVLVGMGFGVSWGTLGQLLMDRVPGADRDKTSALLPTLQSAGYAIGGAVFGLIANLSGLQDGLTRPQIRDALLPVFFCGLAIAIVATVFGYRTVKLAAQGS